MDEPIQELFLKGWEVIGNVLAFPHSKGVVAVGEDKGRKLLLIGEEMAAMDVGNGNLVFWPQGFAASERNNSTKLVNMNSKVAGSPLVLLADNASAVLNEVVVCEHQEVSEGSDACPCSCGSGDEVLQGSIKSEGGKHVHEMISMGIFFLF